MFQISCRSNAVKPALNSFENTLKLNRFGCRQTLVFGPPSEANTRLTRHILMDDENSLMNQARQNGNRLLSRGSLVTSLDNLNDIVFKDREGYHDGYGLGLVTSDGLVEVHKNAKSAAEATDTFKSQVDDLTTHAKRSRPKTAAILGHLRWATSGALTVDNNHPLKAQDHHKASHWLLIHNGTMKKLVSPEMDALIKQHPEFHPSGDSDSARFLSHFMIKLKEKFPTTPVDDVAVSDLMNTFGEVIRQTEDQPKTYTLDTVNLITNKNPFKLNGATAAAPGNTVVVSNGKVVLAHRGVRTLYVGANINNKTNQVDGYVLASEPPKQVAPSNNPNHHMVWAPLAYRHTMALYLNKKGELEAMMRPVTFVPPDSHVHPSSS